MMKERRQQARKHYIHRISYTIQERIAGLFVIIAVSTLIWLLLSSGKKTTVFEESITLYGHIETAQGISNDTEIKISGLRAGTIQSIDIKQNNKIIVTMIIHSKFRELIHTDSTAKLTNPGIAVLGASIIHITSGTKTMPILEDGSTIIIDRIPSLVEALNELIPTFEQIHTSIKNINAILGEVNPKTIGYTFENVQEITASLRNITTQISSGDGTVGSVLYDNEIEDNTKAIVKNLLETTQLMEDMVSMLNQQIANMPELVDKIGPLLNQADRTIKATQRIWPLSSAIGEDSGEEVLTSPAPAND